MIQNQELLDAQLTRNFNDNNISGEIYVIKSLISVKTNRW